MSEKYFVIECSEDGGVFIEVYDYVEKLEEILNSGDLYGAFIEDLTRMNGNPQYWGDNEILIIKGKAIQPKPKTVVEKWEVE